MDTVKTITLIETTLGRRGNGKDERSPTRVITQYWTPDGKLVVEIDPMSVSVTPEDLVNLEEAVAKVMNNNKRATPKDVWAAVTAALPINK